MARHPPVCLRVEHNLQSLVPLLVLDDMVLLRDGLPLHPHRRLFLPLPLILARHAAKG